jgi:type VI secretion system protein ImpG
VYPHYLAPTPSMLIAQFKPDPGDPNLAVGPKVPRGSMMHSLTSGDEATACEFRTAQDVRLWPIEIVSANYFSFAPDLPLNTLPIAQRIKGGVRIRLKTTAGLKFSQTAIDRLCFHLAGRDDVSNKLYELTLATGLGMLVLPGRGPARKHDFLPARSIRPHGFDDDQALLPVTLRSFQGYRLLQEYFSFPPRFRFFELSNLAPVLQRANTDEVEVVILFGRGDATLESVVDGSNFALFCTPAINLFPKRADRIHVTDGAHEYHVVADRTRPLDFEVYEVTAVAGHGVGAESEQEFQPFYAAYSTDSSRQQPAYFTTRREPRLVTAEQRRRGSRSTYIGSEVFLSLVDPTQAPYNGDLRQLSLQVLCTNRDLVLQMPVGVGKTDLLLDMAAPVTRIRVVGTPTRPYGRIADGAVAWRAISHLSSNYLSLVSSTPQEGASALRDVLGLYAAGTDASARRQIEGIRSVRLERVVRRLPSTSGPLAFGRGLEINMQVDEMAFEGGSAYTLGSVLDRYFARYVSVNSFTETVLRSETRGEINRWMPQWGGRPTL